MWVTTVPPILFVIAFKLWLDRKFYHKFMYYIPSETELRQAKIHSAGADDARHRLEKRFGHPALHTELFTPMLHAKMMPLLADVYKGRVGNSGDVKARLGEYGGQKMDAQVVEGVRIAGIDQRDLEYDPVLYQRDRGELDWDARSVASTAIFGPGLSHGRGDSASVYQQKHYYAGSTTMMRSASPAPSAFERYGNKAEGSAIELARMGGSVDQLPLLTDPGYQQVGDALPGYAPPDLNRMSRPPSVYGPPIPQQQQLPPPRFASPAPLQYPPQSGTPYASPVEGYREAPLHRPYSMVPAPHSPHGSVSSLNLPGRGPYRGGYQ